MQSLRYVGSRLKKIQRINRSPGTGDPVDPYGKTKKKQSGTKQASGLMQEETTLLPVLLTVKQVKKTTLSCLHTYGPREKTKRKLPHACQKVRLN